MQDYLDSRVKRALDNASRNRSLDGFFVSTGSERIEAHLERIRKSYLLEPEVYRWGQLIAWLYVCGKLGIRIGSDPDLGLQTGLRRGVADKAWVSDWLNAYRKAVPVGVAALDNPAMSEFYMPSAVKFCEGFRSATCVYESLVTAEQAALRAFTRGTVSRKRRGYGVEFDPLFVQEASAYDKAQRELRDDFEDGFAERFVAWTRKIGRRSDLIFTDRTSITVESFASGLDLTRSPLVRTYAFALSAIFGPTLKKLKSDREHGWDPRPADRHDRINGFVADCVTYHLGYLRPYSSHPFDRKTFTERLRKPTSSDKIGDELEHLGGFKRNVGAIVSYSQGLRRERNEQRKRGRS